jgi:hypothetical protein
MTNPKVEEVMHAVAAFTDAADVGTFERYQESKATLLALVEALATDADRYRFIRDREQARIYVSAIDSIRSTGEGLDFKIDSLLKEQQTPDPEEDKEDLVEDDSILFTSPD